MPSLSIIIPYRSNDKRLENTLLSVLENRPADCELIVAHDGTYADPYRLTDEVVFIQGETGKSGLSLVNAAVHAACSPIVGIVLDGVSVNYGWTDGMVQALADSSVAAAAVSISTDDNRLASAGIDARRLENPHAWRTGIVDAAGAGAMVSGPALACGFYRRNVLLALGGWNENLSHSVADIDLALSLQSLKLHCVSAETSSAGVSAHPEVANRRFTSQDIYHLANLAAAHGRTARGSVAALRGLVDCCRRGQVSMALSWARGLLTNDNAKDRIAGARTKLADKTSAPLKIFIGDDQTHENRQRCAA